MLVNKKLRAPLSPLPGPLPYSKPLVTAGATKFYIRGSACIPMLIAADELLAIVAHKRRRLSGGLIDSQSSGI
jgi:hypothetical protein